LLGWPDIAYGRALPASAPEGVQIVKKLLLVALLGVGALALWRKVQADRAELDLWTEATTGDDE
jgi:MYXO-CTERM domain-containing protein